ncbi:MAG: hypothetical protein WBL40_09140 [Terrimicrobiaceae bacterium]
MRTILSLDDDVLEAARSVSEQRRVPLGVVISELARRGLRPREAKSQVRNGIRLFPSREDGAAVTPEMVKALLEETD